jgi:signal transduction histidine kinase
MRILSVLSRHLLSWPYAVRLGIVVGLFLLCLILLVFGFPSPYDGSLFALPVALAAWLFKGRGALLCIGCILVVLGITYQVRANGLGPSSRLTVLLIGAIALMAEGTVIVYLRHAQDLVQGAQLKMQQAQQAELHAQMAYEYQRKDNHLKEDLLAHLGHELRTPLTAIGGYLELLQLPQEHLDPPQQAEFVAKAIESHDELVGLVNTILQALTVTEEFPPASSELLSVSRVVQEVLEHLDPATVQDYTLQVQIAESIQVWADPQFLRQILRNLLSNAFKYAPPQTVVCIEAAQRDSASSVCLYVQDAGPGIPPNEQPLLFEKFVRLKRDRFGTVPGSGLGLFICRQLVDAMHGRIWVESTGVAGEGSRFCFTLPRTTSEMLDM